MRISRGGVLWLLMAMACGASGSGDGDDGGVGSGGDGWAAFTPGTSWQWQLQGTIDTRIAADVYDIDLFESDSAVISELHGLGRRVICYFDTAYEPNRPDSAQLEPYTGNGIDGWDGQYWVDIRQSAVLDVMLARMDQAVEKGCDAVEPDDVDAYANDPGFDLTAEDQLTFNRALAEAAHARGLAVALKNDLDQIPDLISDFDFAVNEECFDYDECDALTPFIQAGKAVFQAEYGDETLAATLCPQAIALDFDTIVKDRDLDTARISCR